MKKLIFLLLLLIATPCFGQDFATINNSVIDWQEARMSLGVMGGGVPAGGGYSFPASPVVDNFNRDDNDPMTGWTDFWGNGSCTVALGTAGSTEDSGLQYNTAYGPDMETYLTVTTGPSVSISVSNGYFQLKVLKEAGTDTWNLTNWGDVILKTTTQEISNGDSIGMSKIGNTVKCYYKPSGGSWGEVLALALTSYDSDEILKPFTNIGDSTVRIDNFGAGTIATVYTYTDNSNHRASDLYWNGDATGDNTIAWITQGTNHVHGTLSGATIVASGTDPGTASPRSGANVLKLDALNEYISFPITAGDIFSSSEGHIIMDVYLAASTGVNNLFDISVDAQNYFVATVYADGKIYFSHKGNNTVVSMDSVDAIPDATWTNVHFRWSVANNKISIKVGKDAWLDDSDADVVTAFVAEPATFKFGNGTQTDAIYLDNIFIYKTSGL